MEDTEDIAFTLIPDPSFVDNEPVLNNPQQSLTRKISLQVALKKRLISLFPKTFGTAEISGILIVKKHESLPFCFCCFASFFFSNFQCILWAVWANLKTKPKKKKKTRKRKNATNCSSKTAYRTKSTACLS